MSENITAISDANFETDVIGSKLPVLVDFWAQWCGPCKAIAPILDEIAQQFSGKIKIMKLDVDQNPSTPPKFGVRGIPTLIIFKEGQVKATQVGMVSKKDLINFVETNI